MMVCGVRSRDALWGGLIALLLQAPFIAWYVTKPPVPYHNVDVRNLVVSEDTVSLIATFEKNDECTYVNLGVFGGNLGEWDRLDWEDLDVPQGDRFAGHQTLRMRIMIDKPYEVIEVRTRHDCDGEKVDKIFTNIDID